MDTVHAIKTWFEKAVPYPSDINISTQIGVHLEEVAEMLEPLADAALSQETKDQIQFFHDVMLHAQKRFKDHQRNFKLDYRLFDRVALLDALCDQIVTAIGVAHMLEMDIEGALAEVARSNNSKFGPDGQPIFNESRKIMKGPSYTPPELAPFV